MKIFNTVMTTAALVTLLMASASTVYAMDTSDDETNNTLKVRTLLAKKKLELAKKKLELVKENIGFAGSYRYTNDLNEQRQVEASEMPEMLGKRLRSESEHNLRFYGHYAFNRLLARQAWEDPSNLLVERAAADFVFHNKPHLFYILNSEAYHILPGNGANGTLLNKRLTAAMIKYDEVSKLDLYGGDPV